MAENKKIKVKGIDVKIKFIDTIELLGLWETMYNPNFKPVEFDGFRINRLNFYSINL